MVGFEQEMTQRTKKMRGIHYLPLLILVVFNSTQALAQGMIVIGGNAKAQECYKNAQVAGALEFTGGLIDSCDYALDHVKLSRHDRAATLANRGIILTREESLADALKDLQQAISLNPDAADMYVNRGNVFFYEKDYRKAIVDYSKAIEMDIKESHVAFLNRGLAYEGIGDKGQAEADYRQALEFKPQWPFAEDILARFLVRQQENNKTEQ